MPTARLGTRSGRSCLSRPYTSKRRRCARALTPETGGTRPRPRGVSAAAGAGPSRFMRPAVPLPGLSVGERRSARKMRDEEGLSFGCWLGREDGLSATDLLCPLQASPKIDLISCDGGESSAIVLKYLTVLAL